VKVAIATDFHSPWIGGPATFVDNFAAYLVSKRHDVYVLAPSPVGRPSTERGPHYRVERFQTIPVPFGYDMRACPRFDMVAASLRATKPDIVQVHHPFPLGFAAVRAARRLNIPIVAVNHTIPECSLYGVRDSRLYQPAVAAFRRYLRWFLAHADAICTPTATAATLLHEMGLRHDVEVISNGIDVSRFTPTCDRAAARHDLGLPQRPTILYTGRLDAEKDMETWLRAGARVLRSIDAQLVVGGEGTDKPRLQRLVQTLGVEHRVTFPGYLPIDCLPRLYQAADVYCITSAVELQSIATLEALATGLPVVAANALALPELVVDGYNGFLAAPGDVDSFTRGLLTVLQSPDRARVMGARGRERAGEHSLDTVAGRHEDLLARVVSGGQQLGLAAVK
jgi:1,2-diacylglycerol 3-alpha-glucosyltransferase